ncbi:MAG: hypothetical protein R2867_33560 [Caldilineaceae bacterium]
MARVGNANRRATRTDLFRTALLHAEPMARLLETNLLDPIRQDDLVDDDPLCRPPSMSLRHSMSR